MELLMLAPGKKKGSADSEMQVSEEGVVFKEGQRSEARNGMAQRSVG
jgi:hypothetical protein